MKKLTILLLLFIVFAFAEWDVDPDYTNLTADSTIIDDYFLVGDTTTETGGLLIRDNKIHIWRDTIQFACWNDLGQYYSEDRQDCHQIYCEETPSARFVIKCWNNGGGVLIVRSDECKIDTNEIWFFRAQIMPAKDTLDKTGDAGWCYSSLGTYNKRFGESWIMYQIQTDASRTDTSKRWMGADTLFHESENPNKFDNDVLIDGELTSNSITQFPYVDLDIDDTEEYELTVADGKAGWGMASLEAEWTYFRFTAAGVVTLVNNTTNVTTTDGTDNNFNIFDSGTTITFENQLGDNKELNINVWFTP